MVPPKAAPKQATPAASSVFDAMKKNAALAKNMAKAKKVVATREFDGPDGDYLSVLNRISHYTKDGTLGIILEFRVIDSEEYEGQKLVVFFSFKNSDRETIQEVQNRFFETLQLMGLDTDMDDAELDKALANLIASKTPITNRVKTGKQGGKFINVVGVATAAKQVAETEYVEETIEEVPEAVEEEATDKWEEEAVEEPVEEEAVEEVVDWDKPSSWIGYAMVYKSKEVEVVAGDDKTMKCTIKDSNGKKLIVPFSSLTPPQD